MQDITELYCHVDDFFKTFQPSWEAHLLGKKEQNSALSPIEIMTLLIHFHQVQFRNFKQYYLGYVTPYLGKLFPHLLSYSRFIELLPSVVCPLMGYLLHQALQDVVLSWYRYS